MERKAMDAEGEVIKFTDQHAAAIIMDIALGKSHPEKIFLDDY